MTATVDVKYTVLALKIPEHCAKILQRGPNSVKMMLNSFGQ